jgi:acyl-CoA reductase-like NAD-dependent aldehyde dehydrogenase
MSETVVDRAAPRLLVGGRWVGTADTYEVVNPATEQVVGLAPEATPADVHAAVEAARAAFPSWSQTTPKERFDLLLAAAQRVRARVPDLVPLVIAETGATLNVARTMQVPVCASRLERYAYGALEPATMSVPPVEQGVVTNGVAVRQPVGVVACITPYNFPIVNCAGKIGPALAMGNTVVVKPAPQDPLAVIELGRILDEVGFPPGVVNVVTGSGAEAGQSLVAHPDVDMVSFTGSTAVGQAIGEVAGRQMKRLLLELGGKSANVVFADAPLDRAVRGAASVWTFHAGQICTAPTRLLVERPAYDEVVERLAKLAAAVVVGDPADPKTVVGPLISATQRERVEGYIRLGRDEGAELVCGGDRPAHLERGYYLNPTLLANGRNDMRVAREEIFGPVIVAIPFDDEDEAVALANDSEYGLHGYVWTGDTSRGIRVARRMRTGNVSVNGAPPNPEAPFGGFKLSGVGRDGGSFALAQYSELQSIVWPS